MMDASELIRAGRLDECLKQLQADVRSRPADPKLRVFLFQLLAVRGEWERAMTQLNVAADMDAGCDLMAQVCRPLLNAEALRAEIFAGRRKPILFGEPEPWMGQALEAARLAAVGEVRASQQLRSQAFEAAPATPGRLDDSPFEWLADADPRLGPMIEAVIDGTYFWVPVQRISEIRCEAPTDLRDIVWRPAYCRWTNGGESAAMIPARYPDSAASEDAAIQLARKTVWEDHGEGLYLGLGQKILATDQAEVPFLEVQHIVFAKPGAAEESA
jgi:type VI secretion system protein ImpE